MKEKKRGLTLLYIAVTALVTVTICSKSSPLYPLNDWVDANTYLTIGRAMLRGFVPYRDLYEQKGPMLYFIHALAAFISDGSFFGVYVVEVFACFVFLLSAERLIRTVCERDCIALLPLIAMIIYASGAFCHGDSAEELCLPLLGCVMCLVYTKFREKKPFTDREWFFFGALAAVVFWTKLNLTGTFFGLFIAALYLSAECGQWRTLARKIPLAVLGAAAVTLPVALYFAVNSALTDLFEVYFADNLFRYADSASLGKKLLDGVKFTFAFLRLPAAVILLGMAAAALGNHFRELLLLVFILTVTFFSLFGGHLSYRYYPLPLAVFVPPAAAELVCFCECHGLKLHRFRTFFRSAAIAVCAVYCFVLSPNDYLMKYRREELPQFKFAEISAAEGSPAILNYGFIDGGFYLAAHDVPRFKYFCRNNMSVPEMVSAQEYYVRERMPGLIVMRSPEPAAPDAPPGYTLAAQAEFPYYEKYFYYFLYKRI